jgi:hypothetical protein
MEKWERDEIVRLERRVDALERKNWERSAFWMQVWLYGLMAAAWILAGVTIAIHATGHS